MKETDKLTKLNSTGQIWRHDPSSLPADRVHERYVNVLFVSHILQSCGRDYSPAAPLPKLANSGVLEYISHTDEKNYVAKSPAWPLFIKFYGAIAPYIIQARYVDRIVQSDTTRPWATRVHRPVLRPTFQRPQLAGHR